MNKSTVPTLINQNTIKIKDPNKLDDADINLPAYIASSLVFDIDVNSRDKEH